MSIQNPFLHDGNWRIDPDNRIDRSNGPVTTRKMTHEEKVKYGLIKESEVRVMKMTRVEIKKKVADGMSINEIVEVYAPHYPRMGYSVLKAKVVLLASDKKLGCNAKKEANKAEHAEEKEAIRLAAKLVPVYMKDEISHLVDEMMEMVPADEVERPEHYTAGGIETIDFIKAKLTPEQFEGFCVGTVIQYVTRYRLKGGITDLRKAKWYLEKAIAASEV